MRPATSPVVTDASTQQTRRAASHRRDSPRGVSAEPPTGAHERDRAERGDDRGDREDDEDVVPGDQRSQRRADQEAHVRRHAGERHHTSRDQIGDERPDDDGLARVAIGQRAPPWQERQAERHRQRGDGPGPGGDRRRRDAELRR